MIDLDNFSMRRDIEALLSDIEKSSSGLGSMVIDIHGAAAEEIITRLRQAEKDAARYRFMRDMSDEVDVSRFFHIEVSERDAEIDEAMQCK